MLFLYGYYEFRVSWVVGANNRINSWYGMMSAFRVGIRLSFLFVVIFEVFILAFGVSFLLFDGWEDWGFEEGSYKIGKWYSLGSGLRCGKEDIFLGVEIKELLEI